MPRSLQSRIRMEITDEGIGADVAGLSLQFDPAEVHGGRLRSAGNILAAPATMFRNMDLEDMDAFIELPL